MSKEISGADSGKPGQTITGLHWQAILRDVLLTVAWTALRAKACLPDHGTLEHFIAFNAPLPFAARILAPLLAYPLVAGGWFSVWHAFLLVDALGFFAFLHGIRFALRALVPDGFALVGGFVIPLMLVPALFISGFYPPIFFPYDMTSIAFIAWGMGMVLRQRAIALACLLPFATLNRETAVILPLAWGLIWLGRMPLRTLIKTGALLSLAYAVPRAVILFLTRHQPAHYGFLLPLQLKGNWIIDSNVGWLSYPANIALWIALLGFVPILLPAWLQRFDDVGRRLLPLLAFLLAALLFCGRYSEARIYAEWITVGGMALAPAAAAVCCEKTSSAKHLANPLSVKIGTLGVAVVFILAGIGYSLLHLFHPT